MPPKQINPGHNAVRDTLRIVGPIIALAGLTLIIVGMADFFHSFGRFGPPRLFWCPFVGMPLLFVGLVLSSYGYMGKVLRYTAEETAPVGKDTFNYLAEETREGVQTVAGAIGQGLREGGLGGTAPTMVRCHKCNALAPAEAKFCGQCGQSLGKTKSCPGCREWNDPDARFCDNCGRAFE
jgi:RNA polymerase subunit RPABC4/transcription elongation factor Spt4